MLIVKQRYERCSRIIILFNTHTTPLIIINKFIYIWGNLPSTPQLLNDRVALQSQEGAMSKRWFSYYFTLWEHLQNGLLFGSLPKMLFFRKMKGRVILTNSRLKVETTHLWKTDYLYCAVFDLVPWYMSCQSLDPTGICA